MSLYPFSEHPGFFFYYHPHLLDPPSSGRSSFSARNHLTRSVPNLSTFTRPTPPAPYNHLYARYGYDNATGYSHSRCVSDTNLNHGIRRSMSNYMTRMKKAAEQSDTTRSSRLEYTGDDVSGIDDDVGGTYRSVASTASRTSDTCTWRWAKHVSPRREKVGLLHQNYRMVHGLTG